MNRLLMALAAVATMTLVPRLAHAGSPHFVTCSVTRVGDSLYVTGKEAGLGDEAEIDIRITATAICINGGEKHPKAQNKTDVNNSFPETVQNGKADFTETVYADFDPDCSPPMSIEYTNVTVCDDTNTICCNVQGTF